MTPRIAQAIKQDNSLYHLGLYLSWDCQSPEAILDGEFTSADLRAIADHMDKHYQKPTTQPPGDTP